jgi:hypothetical protein
VNQPLNTHMRLGSLIVMIWLTLAGAGFARAQDAETRKHFLHELGGPFIVYRTKVQVELKLTNSQKESLLAKQLDYVQETMKVEDQLAGTQAEDRERAMQSLRAESAERFWAFLHEVLNGSQLKRMHQLELQHEGPSGLFRPEISKVLKITPEERQEVIAVIQEMQTKIAPLLKEARSVGKANEIRPKVIKIIEEFELKAEERLSPSQRKQWQEVRGTPFDTLSE